MYTITTKCSVEWEYKLLDHRISLYLKCLGRWWGSFELVESFCSHPGLVCHHGILKLSGAIRHLPFQLHLPRHPRQTIPKWDNPNVFTDYSRYVPGWWWRTYSAYLDCITPVATTKLVHCTNLEQGKFCTLVWWFIIMGRAWASSTLTY